MREQSTFRKYFPKRIPKEVKEDIQRAVSTLISEEPRVREVRLFGSYAKGCFTEQSDIDIGVFIDSPEYFYKYYDLSGGEDGIINGICEGSKDVERLGNSLNGKVNFPIKYSIYVMSRYGYPYTTLIDEKIFLAEISNGKLLYKMPHQHIKK